MLPLSSAAPFAGELTVAYLAAGVLFILSLGGLSGQESARRGNAYGILGMGIALVATLVTLDSGAYVSIGIVVGIGAIIGAILAARVAMTAMPELVAALHSFVGLAAVLVGLSFYLAPGELSGAERVIHDIEVFVDVTIGAVTFTGSVVAWGKLAGRFTSRALLLPARHILNLTLLLIIMAAGVLLVQSPGAGFNCLLVNAAVASILGIHLVMAIGGADMPVVVSLLNSYSGWTAAAAGFMLGNDLLIVTGALVGSSGAILSFIMCRAMNRSIWSVVFGGFGETTGKSTSRPSVELEGDVVAIEASALAEKLKTASRVVVVPGYGMAVAQAQHGVKELGRLLQEAGAELSFAIHPVAGRLPGHMNVLLAEAGVPYDIVLEMEEVNDSFAQTDVAVIIGANDIVNPGALEDESSPIYGMPVLEVWKAKTVVVMKRSMNVGYAGIANPLFFKDNTCMLFGDAKESVDNLCAALKE